MEASAPIGTMASLELEPGGVEVWRSERCQIRQWCPVQGIVCNRYVGDVSEEFVEPVLAFLRRAADQSAPITTFSDADQMTGYDIVFRVRIVLGIQKLHGRIDTIHMYTRSKAGLTVTRAASLVLRNIVAHGSRQSLDTALAKAIAERGRRP